MAATESTVKITLPASGDLSAAKYLAGYVDSAGRVVKRVTAGADVHGIIMNKPAAIDRPTEFAISGRIPATAGAAFNAGVNLGVTTAGKLVTATTGQAIVAVSLEVASGDGSVVDVLLGYRGVA